MPNLLALLGRDLIQPTSEPTSLLAWQHFVSFMFVRVLASRLQLPSQHRKLSEQYRQQCKIQAAAKLWVEGVPWAEAITMARDAIDKAYPSSKKGRGKGKAKSRAMPKGKAKGKGRG